MDTDTETLATGITCACGAEIHATAGTTECGGEGEGGCCILYGDGEEERELCALEGCGPHSDADIALAEEAHTRAYWAWRAWKGAQPGTVAAFAAAAAREAEMRAELAGESQILG